MYLKMSSAKWRSFCPGGRWVNARSMYGSFHYGSGAHFTNNFSITIQMWWKFHFALIQVLIKWSLQNFAHDTTAGLSWHVHNFVVICSTVIELELNEFSIEFELWWKKYDRSPHVSPIYRSREVITSIYLSIMYSKNMAIAHMNNRHIWIIQHSHRQPAWIDLYLLSSLKSY